jgi:hypothetical protein
MSKMNVKYLSFYQFDGKNIPKKAYNYESTYEYGYGYRSDYEYELNNKTNLKINKKYENDAAMIPLREITGKK